MANRVTGLSALWLRTETRVGTWHAACSWATSTPEQNNRLSMDTKGQTSCYNLYSIDMPRYFEWANIEKGPHGYVAMLRASEAASTPQQITVAVQPSV